jgi:two-component system sensor histidine kinase VicK
MIGAYLGVPIILSDGRFFGTLCAVDPEPQILADRQVELLVLLARLLTKQVERDELVSMITHEARSPLTTLTGFAELLLSREYGETERREIHTVMHREGLRISHLLDGFLGVGQSESGPWSVTLEPTDLRAVIAQSVTATRIDLAQSVEMDLPAALPTVLADSNRIRQVLINLLANAGKYSPVRGEIAVSARAADDVLTVCVADCGLGIPPEALPRLFDKFYRVDSADRRGISGTGLGLAICREIVEAHGGQIWAESAGAGHGSRFCFTLPLERAPNHTP